MDKLNSFKKLIVLGILTVLLSLFSTLGFAFAKIDSIDFEKYEGSASYHYFDSPEFIISGNTNFYCLDNAKIYAFSLVDNSLSRTIIPNSMPYNIAACDDVLYTVEHDGVYEYTKENNKQLIAKTNLKNIFVNADKLYLADTNNIYIYSKETLSLQHTLPSPKAIEHFTVLGDEIHILTQGSNRLRSNIYTLKTDLSITCALENSNKIYKIIALGNQNKIGLLYASKISLYSFRVNELFEDSSIDFDDVADICFSLDSILVLTGERSIVSLELDLSKSVEIIASSSNSESFYKNPTDITTRFGKTYVADKAGDRVSINDGKAYSYLSLSRPNSVAIDNGGKVFVAYSENKIATFDMTNNRIDADELIKVKDNVEDSDWFSDISITDIKLDSQDNLYLLSHEGKLYVKTQGSDYFVFVLNDISAIAHSSVYSDVFAIDTTKNQIIKLNLDDKNKIQVQNTNIDSSLAIDLAVDVDNSIYLLKPNNLLERYNFDSTYSPLPDICDYVQTEGLLTRLDVSSINNNNVKYRDIVILDSILSTIKIVPHGNLGISYEDLDQKETVSATFKTLLSDSKNIIHTVTKKGGAEVYAQSSETHVIKTLSEGFTVLVLDYNPKLKFTRIIFDTVSIGSNSQDLPLSVGYINTANLSAPLPYSNEHENICHVWLHPISVYALPSRQSPKLDGFEAVEKNTPISVLDFVTHVDGGKNTYGYKDNFPNTDTVNQNNIWYRVKVVKDDIEYEGFVFASGVSILGGNPDLSIRPQTNAVIIAKSKDAPNLGAYVYYFDDETNTYKVDIKYDILEVGTKVEVVGKFDSSEPYTKILFYSSYGTVEAYVETANLKYQGVNVAQVVAIVLIIIAIILIIVLLIRKSKKQRERIF